MERDPEPNTPLLRAPIRRKASISSPGDPIEREADEVADKVMRMAEPVPLGSTPGACQREWPARADARVDTTAAVRATTRHGTPLPREARDFFEPRFGHDFGHVRVHVDGQAAEAARAVHARAFAIGHDIVFGEGHYAPATEKGRRLLAHELAHVVQGPRDVLHRTPGEDARDSWDAIVRRITYVPESEDRTRRAQTAIDRMLGIERGAELVNDLYRFFHRGNPPRMRSRIDVAFMDELPPTVRDALGHFEPDDPWQPRYAVKVKNQHPSPHEGRTMRLRTSWPSRQHPEFSYTHSAPESGMANTLFHEFLHIWFVHRYRQDDLGSDEVPYRTGHGSDIERGQVDPRFVAPLRVFVADLDALEERLRREAEERAREQEAEVSPVPSPDAVRTIPRGVPREPSSIGGAITAHGGASFRSRESDVATAFTDAEPDARGAAILGADLILGRIAALNLGIRGVYLSPDHLLAGGAVGLRLREDEANFRGTRIENPLFFDIELGLLVELSPMDGRRLTNAFAGMGSVGIGQEYGREGPRFFWRVGGFVIVSDTGSVHGGPTGGIGVGF